MPDDEPLDDARAVGTAAAAAAARVTESVARHVSEAKARERAALERAQDQQAAQDALRRVDHQTQGQDRTQPAPGRVDVQTREQDTGRRVSDLDQARSWAATDPQRWRHYESEVGGAGTPTARRNAENNLVGTWKDATQSYDSTEQRGKRDAAREEVGVPLEGRRVVAVADQMNGQDPTLAAAVGRAQKTRARTAVPMQDRTRGR